MSLNEELIFALILTKRGYDLVNDLALCTGVLGLLLGATMLLTYLGNANVVSFDLAAWIPIILVGMLGDWLSETIL